jgi:DNA repair protein RadA
MLRCSTGSKSLDELLLGGIETQAVTEFYGEFGSGKSQICHTLCAMAKQPINEGGLDGGVIYIDTEGTFRPERLQQIAESRGFVLLEVLKKVSVCKVYNSSHLELIIKDLGKYINEFNAKLVIIDSIISLHRAEFIGRGTLADRQQKLNSILHKLVRVAEIFNIAIVITNQVLSSPDTFFGDPTKAAGGNVIGHTSTYRIYLRKSGENRIAKMIDSPYHPYSDIRITVKGIDDLEDSTTREKRRRLRLTLAEYESEPEIEDLANPNDELRKKIVTLADTVREWNNETNRIRKTVKEQFEEILTLGLHKYNMEKTDLRRLVEEIFLIHGVNESYLRKLLPAKLKDPSKTRISYLQRQNIEKERQRLLQQKGFRIPAEIRN